MSLKGQPTQQIINGSDRANTTILAAVSGSGEILPLLILFQGKKSKQHGLTKPDNKFYPWIYANEKGGWSWAFFINGL